MSDYVIRGARVLGADPTDLLLHDGVVAEVARRVDALPGHAVVMHPGPMNRGLEISADAADSPRSTIVEQVSNGVAVRMAVLYLLLSGAPEPRTTAQPVTEGARA